MNRKWAAAVVLMLVLSLVVGCAAAPMQQAASDRSESIEEEMGMDGEWASAPSAAEPAPAAPQEAPAASDAAMPEVPSQRMIIRTAMMRVMVDDSEETLAAIEGLVSSHEGYIADVRMWRQNDQAYANATLRVPAESLDQVLDAIRDMVLRVDSRNISGQDVTEEYTDVQARLRNLEATEVELLALLTEVRENRGKAEEILAVHQRITEIRAQIESLKGRSQYLERMTALATINLEIYPKAAPPAVVQTGQWSPLVTAGSALRSLIAFVQVLVDLGIYLLIFSPVVLVPLAVIWLLVRFLRRRGRKEQDLTAASS